jgi:hypothetical protein
MERINERIKSLVALMVARQPVDNETKDTYVFPSKATAREPIKQAGYISATSAIHAQVRLRNAAGPYKIATSGHGPSFDHLIGAASRVGGMVAERTRRRTR